jgi:cytochrome P450
MPTRSRLPKATLLESLGVFMDVVAPNLAKGAIIRRPRVVGMAERLGLDRRAVRRLQKLRNRYEIGPLMLRMPVRDQAVVLRSDHVRRVLEHSPEPFATASSEKRAALAHFEPKGALISHGAERAERRRYNEEILQSGRPMHTLADRFAAVARQEGEELLDRARHRGGELDWETFAEGWFQVVRRVVLGDGAWDDQELRKLINQLRHDANWAFLKPRRDRRRKRFFDRLNAHLQRAEPGSLAHVMANVPHGEVTAPDHQVPQWLFAFDPAGIATFRALALLAAHPEEAARVRAEAMALDDTARTPGDAAPGDSAPGDEAPGDAAPGEAPADAALAPLPRARAAVLETLRLWPTTPMVLRQTTEATTWEKGVMPEGTGVLLFAPFFHRDDQRVPFADRFAPEVWLEEGHEQQGRPPGDWAFIPFSDGPAVCPGRNLVLFVTSHMLATLAAGGHPLRLTEPERMDPARLPGTLDNYSLRFRLDAAYPG